MGAVNVNNVSLAYAEETSLGVVPDDAFAEYLEPNVISDYGSDITTVARNPISKDRQNKKGTITDLSSMVSVDGDTTMSFLLAFLQGAMYSTWHKRPMWYSAEITASQADGGFTVTVPTVTPLVAGTLIFCRGFINGANNGLKVVASGSTTTNVKVTDGASLVNESGTEGATVHVVGYQAGADDIQIDADGNVISTTVDFTTMGLDIGSAIFIGGIGASTSFAAPENSGLARVRQVEANKLVLDKKNAPYVLDDGAGKTIQIFFGWFLRNVATDHPDFAERSYAFELNYPGLENGADGYEYALGNLINTFELSMPLSEKSTLTVSTFGKDVEPITSTRRAWTHNNPLYTEAFSTVGDFLRLRMQNIDETGLTTYFKEATLTINNNASGENVIGKLGPEFVNYGNFDVSLALNAVFTSGELTAKIRNNCTVTCDWALMNNDGCIYFDIPSMTLGDGSREFPVNEKVKIALTSSAFGDTALGYTMSQTYFPYLPTDKATVC